MLPSKTSLLLAVLFLIGCSAFDFDCPILDVSGESFNALIFEDFRSPDAKLEGRLAVGGDLILRSYDIGESLIKQKEVIDTVIVGGDVVWHKGTLQLGNLVYAGKSDVAESISKKMLGHMRNDGSRFDFTHAEGKFQDISKNLKYFSGGEPFNYGPLACDKVPSVYTITCEDFGKLDELTINNTNADVLTVLNILGDDDCHMRDVKVSALSTSNILWNFPDSSSVHLGAETIPGSLLAPFAKVQAIGGEIQGELVAKSYFGTSMIRDQPLTACVPVLGNSVLQVSVDDVAAAYAEKVENGPVIDESF